MFHDKHVKCLKCLSKIWAMFAPKLFTHVKVANGVSFDQQQALQSTA